MANDMPPDKVRFPEISQKIPKKAGVYQIYTDSGTPLKVGIAKDLRQRLSQHRSSDQSCLKLKSGGNRENPSDVLSKRSILAKHLYYDNTLTTEFDLTTEQGRHDFLDQRCYILFEVMETREAARAKEQVLESSAIFRYVGKVVLK